MNGEGGIRTHASLRTNGFQDRLVMTTSIPLHNVFCCCRFVCLTRRLVYNTKPEYICQHFFKVFLFFLFFLSKSLFIGLHLQVDQLVMQHMKLVKNLPYTHKIRCKSNILRCRDLNVIITTFK